MRCLILPLRQLAVLMMQRSQTVEMAHSFALSYCWDKMLIIIYPLPPISGALTSVVVRGTVTSRHPLQSPQSHSTSYPISSRPPSVPILGGYPEEAGGQNPDGTIRGNEGAASRQHLAPGSAGGGTGAANGWCNVSPTERGFVHSKLEAGATASWATLPPRQKTQSPGTS